MPPWGKYKQDHLHRMDTSCILKHCKDSDRHQGLPLSLESYFPVLRKILNPKSSQSQKHIFDYNLKSTKAEVEKSILSFEIEKIFGHFFSLLSGD